MQRGRATGSAVPDAAHYRIYSVIISRNAIYCWMRCFTGAFIMANSIQIYRVELVQSGGCVAVNSVLLTIKEARAALSLKDHVPLIAHSSISARQAHPMSPVNMTSAIKLTCSSGQAMATKPRPPLHKALHALARNRQISTTPVEAE